MQSATRAQDDVTTSSTFASRHTLARDRHRATLEYLMDVHAMRLTVSARVASRVASRARSAKMPCACSPKRATSGARFFVERSSRDARRRASESEGANDDTLSNLDKLLGDLEPSPRRETGETPKPRALDAQAKAEAAQVAADLAAAQARIAREKTSMSGKKLNRKSPEEEYDFSERAIAALVYMLPLLDSLKYSKFLLLQFPVFGLALLPLSPLISLWFNLGFLQIVVFFATYLGVVQNQNMKRFVRFNAQQAVLLDILLIVPDLLTRTFQGIDGSGPTGGIGLQVEIIFFNSVFLFTYICCVVGAIGSTAGKEIKLPLIGDAAESQQPR